jgi:1-deoxy-D-xylulose-5-phosphate synthase
MAAKELKEQHKLYATVVNSRFVKPLDVDLMIKLATKIPHVITVEENVLTGGFGSAVLEAINDAQIEPCRIKRVGLPDKFIEHGPQKTLREAYQIGIGAIIDAALMLAGESSLLSEKQYFFSNRAS